MKKKKTKVDIPEQTIEKLMQPLVAEAEKDARHFVAQTMNAVLALQKKYKNHEESVAVANRAMDEMLSAFCNAQCSAWRMMFANMMELGFINPDILDVPDIINKLSDEKDARL